MVYQVARLVEVLVCLNESLGLQKKNVGIAYQAEIKARRAPRHDARNDVRVFGSKLPLLARVLAVDVIGAAPVPRVCVTAEREAYAAYGKVKARIHVSLIVDSHVDAVVNVAGRAGKVRQAVLVGAEGVNQVLAAQEKVVAVAVKVALADGAIQHVGIIVMRVVGRNGELDGENRLVFVVILNLRHVQEVGVKLVFAAADYVV